MPSTSQVIEKLRHANRIARSRRWWSKTSGLPASVSAVEGEVAENDPAACGAGQGAGRTLRRGRCRSWSKRYRNRLARRSNGHLEKMGVAWIPMSATMAHPSGFMQYAINLGDGGLRKVYSD